MNKVQSSMPATDGEFIQPEAVQGDAPAPEWMVQARVRMDEGAGQAEHSLLSRPTAPQGRRSLFRR